MMDRLSNEVWEEYGMDGGMVPEYDKYKNIRLNNFYGARLQNAIPIRQIFIVTRFFYW